MALLRGITPGLEIGEHLPRNSNLLWESGCKCVDCLKNIAIISGSGFPRWCKAKDVAADRLLADQGQGMLEAEGHEVIQKGSRFFVKDYTQKLLVFEVDSPSNPVWNSNLNPDNS
jgi:hypothetical protein